MSSNIDFAHSYKERGGSLISSLTATYEQLLDDNSNNKGGWVGGECVLNKGRNDCGGMRT